MNKSILITGANAGIGKDTARQLALKSETEKIYLACRNESKAIAAQKELEEKTGRAIFEIIIMDVSDLDSVKSAIKNIRNPIDALIMNAGGMGGKTPDATTKEGATQLFNTNVLGHVLLLEELLENNMLNNVALFAATEAARGVPKMGMKRPNLKTSSVDEFSSIIDGSFFGKKFDAMEAYGPVKYVGVMWLSSLARKYPQIRFISMSPGGTSGTEVMEDLSFMKKLFFKYIAMPILMPLMGMVHALETGAKRFVDGINDESLGSGTFYGSKENVLTGVVIDQSELFADLKNVNYQNNANAAIHRYLK